MREVTTYGRIQAGELRISHRDKLMEALAHWPDGRVVVTVKKIFNHRSHEQNAFLHGVVIPEVRLALIEAGYNPAEVTEPDVKEYLKAQFARKQINNEAGETISMVQPTSEMTTVEMMEFIESIRQFAGEYLNHYIPSPNEQLKVF